MRSRMVHLFKGADLRCGEFGLAALAKKERGVDVYSLSVGQVLCFLSNDREKAKYIGNTGYGLAVMSIRSPKGRLEERALVHVAAAFGGGRLDYGAGLEKTIHELLPPKRSTPQQ